MNISNRKLGIGIPSNLMTLPTSFFDSFTMMDKSMGYVYLRSGVGDIAEMRNQIVKQALDSSCSHVIMLDTDQIYPVDTITRLLAHKKDIVGGKVHRRYPPFDPLLLRGAINSYESVTSWAKDELIEVDATGTGCLLIATEVFKKLPYPWFRFRKLESGAVVGEDIGFCSDARAVGYKIYVDTGCKIGHLSWMVVTEETHLLFKAARGEFATAAREINALE